MRAFEKDVSLNIPVAALDLLVDFGFEGPIVRGNKGWPTFEEGTIC